MRLDFSSGNFKEPGYLHKDVMAQLGAIEDEAAVAGRYDTAPARWFETGTPSFLRHACQTWGRLGGPRRHARHERAALRVRRGRNGD